MLARGRPQAGPAAVIIPRGREQCPVHLGPRGAHVGRSRVGVHGLLPCTPCGQPVPPDLTGRLPLQKLELAAPRTTLPGHAGCCGGHLVVVTGRASGINPSSR